MKIALAIRMSHLRSEDRRCYFETHPTVFCRSISYPWIKLDVDDVNRQINDVEIHFFGFLSNKNRNKDSKNYLKTFCFFATHYVVVQTIANFRNDYLYIMLFYASVNVNIFVSMQRNVEICHICMHYCAVITIFCAVEYWLHGNNKYATW